MIKLALVILIIFFSKNSYSQIETKFGLIDGYCKKYEIDVEPILFECMDVTIGECKGPIIDDCKYRSCPKGLEGEEITFRTIIGKENSGCGKLIKPITFNGRAYVNDYELTQNLSKCVMEGICNNVVFKKKLTLPDDFSFVSEYEIIKVEIYEPSYFRNGFIIITIKYSTDYYIIEAYYSYNIIYKGTVVHGILESYK